MSLRSNPNLPIPYHFDDLIDAISRIYVLPLTGSRLMPLTIGVAGVALGQPMWLRQTPRSAASTSGSDDIDIKRLHELSADPANRSVAEGWSDRHPFVPHD